MAFFFQKTSAVGSAGRNQPINLPRNVDKNDVVNRVCGYDQKTEVEIDVRKAIEEGYRNLTLSLSMTTNSSFTIPTDAEMRGEHIIVKSGVFTNKGRLNCDVINYGSMGEAVFINRGTYGDERACSVNMYNARVENYGIMGLKELKFGGRMTLKGDIVAQDVILDHEEGTIGTAERLEVLNSFVGKFGMLTVSEKIEFKPGSRFVGEYGFRLVCKEGCTIVNGSSEDIIALLVVSGRGVLANIRPGSTVTSDAKVWSSCYSSMVSEYNRIWRALDNKENKTLALGLAQRFLPADASNPLALLALNECVMGLYSRGPQLSIFRLSDENGNDATAIVRAMSGLEKMPDFTGFVKKEMTKFMVDPLREEATRKLGKIRLFINTCG